MFRISKLNENTHLFCRKSKQHLMHYVKYFGTIEKIFFNYLTFHKTLHFTHFTSLKIQLFLQQVAIEKSFKINRFLFLFVAIY